MRPLYVVLASVLVYVISTGVLAHEVHQSNGTKQDYSRYKTQAGKSCCNMQDCRDVRYQHMPDGSLKMEVADGNWITIDRGYVNREHSDDGRAHWCGVHEKTKYPTTYCAILPHHDASLPQHYASAAID